MDQTKPEVSAAHHRATNELLSELTDWPQFDKAWRSLDQESRECVMRHTSNLLARHFPSADLRAAAEDAANYLSGLPRDGERTYEAWQFAKEAWQFAKELRAALNDESEARRGE